MVLSVDRMCEVSGLEPIFDNKSVIKCDDVIKKNSSVYFFFSLNNRRWEKGRKASLYFFHAIVV